MAIMSKTASYDCPLDSKKLDSLDNMNISDSIQVTKQINSSTMSSSPKSTRRKRKPKARKKKRTKGKYMTKVRCIANSLNYNYREDSNNKMPDVQEDSIQSLTVSESSIDLEDWIVFGDDELNETCNKQRMKTSPTETHYTPIFNSSMRNNDNPCKDSNSDAKIASIRLRSLSESSTNSEDSNYVSITLDEGEATERPRMRYDCLTKMNDERCKDYNRQMQKNLFQHRRLPSDSSECSDDFISFENTDSNNSENTYTSTSSFATEEVDGCVETNLHDGDNQLNDSIIFTDEDGEKLRNTQTKKVSFDPTPVVHVMVTWNYAYRAARRGPWEEIARDNERFRGRIKSIAIVLDPILKSKHRSQVWQERFAFPE
ncbi:PR15A phosphatase, partial [Acromyrmex charruanus]